MGQPRPGLHEGLAAPSEGPNRTYWSSLPTPPVDSLTMRSYGTEHPLVSIEQIYLVSVELLLVVFVYLIII